ncbi:predicted protein [Pyrenophora tritici-repentis Pt-1C-BFP]|uniref:Uncharacterized protein n=1 Tax=Pyrenophora tritici-repentis (strain Pt-1C-BFP) TaxID=426418 RepID=B2W7S0_PYRTR|nr:uncharacterized protein PTRG_05858 [Pyrenophora tritici-repentis Pt-1C-BFP]EDU48778.1 predicted protein [Pyrenophora tritici-repentis Pt-1C-BFP]
MLLVSTIFIVPMHSSAIVAILANSTASIGATVVEQLIPRMAVELAFIALPMAGGILEMLLDRVELFVEANDGVVLF